MPACPAVERPRNNGDDHGEEHRHGTVPTSLEISFFRFSDQSLVVCRKIVLGGGRGTSLAPRTSFADIPNNDSDLPDDTQFSVVIKSFGAPAVALVNEQRGSADTSEAAAYGGVSVGSVKLALPNVTRRYFGYDTPIIVPNLGSAPTTASALFISFDGTQRVGVDLSIDPGRSARYTGPPLAAGTAWVLDVRFQACDNCGAAVDLPADSVGAFKIQTLTHGATAIDPNGVIAAVVLPTSDTTAMAYQARPPVTAASLPNVTRRLGGDAGWTTPIRLSGAGAVTMQWFRISDGGPVLTQQFGVGISCCGEAPVSRYRAITIDPRDIRELSDDTQYSVTITAVVASPGRPAPPFSVVVTELAAGGDNAMAYEGFAGP